MKITKRGIVAALVLTTIFHGGVNNKSLAAEYEVKSGNPASGKVIANGLETLQLRTAADSDDVTGTGFATWVAGDGANTVKLQDGGWLLVKGYAPERPTSPTLANGILKATGGKISLRASNTTPADSWLVLGEGSSIADSVEFDCMTSNGVVRVDNGGVIYLGSGDTYEMDYIKNNRTDGEGVILTGGELQTKIIGDGTTLVTGNVVNKHIEDSTTKEYIVENNIKIGTTGSFTTNADKLNVQNPLQQNDAIITNDAENGLVLTGGTLNKKVTGDGSTQIKSGEVTNTAAIEQKVSVKSGATFKNTTGSITNTLTIEDGATAENSSTLANVTNNATFTQSAGTIADATNEGTFNFSGGTVSKYTQSEATSALNILNNQTFNLDGESSITGGNIVLGSNSPASTGSISLKNGKETTAVVTTNGASAIEIINGSTLTTSGNSNIASEASVIIGNASTTGVLNVSSGKVSLDSNDTWSSKGTVNVNNASAELELAGVTQSGSFNQTVGTTTIKADQTLGSGTSISGGTLDIKDGNLTLTGGSVNAGTTKITKNLTIAGANVTLDGDSDLSKVDWKGDVELNSGSLILRNITDKSRASSYNKEGKLTAKGGTLDIDSTNVLLGNGDEIADAVILKLSGDLQIGKTGSTDKAVVAITSSGDNKDLWTNGNVILQGDGELTVKDIVTTDAKSLQADGGKLSIIGTSTTLNNANDKITYDTNVTLNIDNNGGAIGIQKGLVQLDSFDTLTSGQISLVGETAELDLKGVSTANNKLYTTNGTLKIETGTTTLENAGGDIITENIALTIASDGKLKVNGTGTIIIDGTDSWNGGVELNSGNVVLKDITTEVVTNGTITYKQDGGNLTMSNSKLSLHDANSTITGGNIELLYNSTLTFDNGSANNKAVIVSNNNVGNALTIGGDNNTTLTLEPSSNINSNTAITIEENGTLTAKGNSIKGNSTVGLTNDGIFNLSGENSNVGIIARAINNKAGNGLTGTVNLTGITESSANGTINQANVVVGDGTNDATFSMGADLTANTLLTVKEKGEIINADKNIIAEKIDNSGNISPNTGNITVKNGGTNVGTIRQNNITLEAGTLENTGGIIADGTFKNEASSTVTNGSEGKGRLIVREGYNKGNITQGLIFINANNTSATNPDGFVNDGTMKADSSSTATMPGTFINVGTFTNNKTVEVANTANNGTLLNVCVINSTADSAITVDKLTNSFAVGSSEMNGTINLTKSKVAVVYQTDDIKGIINVLGSDVSADKTDLSIKGNKPNFAGTMNVGKVDDSSVKSTLNLSNGNILSDAILNVAKGNIINVDGANSSVAIDGNNDTYAGDIVNNANGKVTMKDMSVTLGDTSTTSGGELPYFEQNSGELNLENAKVTMKDSSKLSGGDLNVDTKSVFNSVVNKFTVDNLTNAGVVRTMNKTFEDYTIGTGLHAGDGISDKQGDFAIDLYARNSATAKTDTYEAPTIFAKNGTDGVLHISDWNFVGDPFGSDAPKERSIKFNNPIFKGAIASGHNIQFTATDKEVLTPIAWYRLNSNGGGNYSFDISRYNPMVFRGQVTTLAQYQNQLAIDDMLFNHTMLDQGFKGNDYITSNPNKYASATDLYPPYQYSRKDGGLWVKTYGTFEKLQMNQGFKVGNNSYGTLIGADFGLKELKHGWSFMPTAYIGYNGAHQYWSGIGAYQNGGQAGFLGTWYKNDLMIGALAYGGVYGNEMTTPRGNDDTFNYFGGGSVKAAYNWKFRKNWALQPNLLVAYNYFGKQTWNTRFGDMGMMSAMLHGINIAPGLNLIWEKETFSIYGTIQYMYNVNQAVGGRAAEVSLPHLEMDRGYIQYGIGANKKFTDRFSGYLQAVIRNVGRNGIGLQMGFQWLFGQGGSNKVKSGNVSPEKEPTKIILKGNR